jgi:hypothetical protein
MPLRRALLGFLFAACSQGIAADTPCATPCADHEACVKATCVPLDCDNALCGTSEVCVSNACVNKACVGVICPGDKICANGTCFPRPCGSNFCGDTEACVNNACVDARCVGITCDMGTVCANGRCLAPTCQGAVCDSGQVCEDNVCVDKSCVGVLCPGMQTCHGGICSQGCSALAPCITGQACVNAVCRPAAAGLHFTNMPVTAVAGTCSDPLTVELVDANGARTAAAATEVMALSGSLMDTAFFVDPACTVTASALAFQPGDEVVTFYFRASHYGSLDVTASITDVGMATQTEPVSAPPASLAITSAPQVLAAGACSASIDVEVHDAAGMPSAGSQPRVLTLTSDSMTLSWFSDSACTSAAGQVVLQAGSSVVHLFARDTHAGVSMLTASSAGLTSGAQALTINPGLPSRVGFDTTPRDIEAGACSLPVTVRAVDDFGNPSGLTAPAQLTPFAPSAAQITFFTDRVCTTEIASGKFTLTLPAGTASATLYLKPLQAGATVLGVSAPGLGAGSQTENVYPSAPFDITFATPQQTVGTGLCSSAFTVAVEDRFQNQRDWTQGDTVDLSNNFGNSLTLYTDAMCTQALGSNGSVAVSAGSTGVTFWAKSTVPGTAQLSAYSHLLNTWTYQSVDFSNAAPVGLVFVETSPAVKTGACSDVFTVRRQDAFMNPTSPNSPTQVALSGPAGVQFFASNDSTCVSAITGVTITSGTSDAYYRVRAPSGGNVMLVASSAGIANGTVTLRSYVLPDRFSVTTAPQSVAAGACSGILTLRSETSTGTPVIPTLDAQVSVGGYYVSTYSDNACGVGLPGSQVLIAADGGTTTGSYYFTYPFAGPLTLNANANFYAPTTGQYLGSAAGAQVETIVAGPASQLVLTMAPGSSTAGSCSGSWTVEARDQFNNPSPGTSARTVTLQLQPMGGFDFFAGGTCSGSPVSTVTIPMGGSSTLFSLRATAAGTKTVSVNSTGVTGDSRQHVVYAGVVQGISFTSLPQSVPNNTCSAVTTVTSVDQYGNASGVPTDLQLLLEVTAGAATFYSDMQCSMAINSGNPALIGVGASATNFHFKPSMSGTLTLRATAASYTPVTQNETVQ